MTTSDQKSLSLYQVLCTDLQAIGVVHPTLLRMIWCAAASSEFMTVLLFRLAAACVGRGIFGKIGERLLLRLSNLLTSCYITSHATIGTRLHLPHPTGIVIGEATIGNNVSIFQNVTLGISFSKSDPLEVQYPTVGDNVKISAGAVLVGDIKIGNNVIIGANAVVLNDVPDNSIAVGVPARILPRD